MTRASRGLYSTQIVPGLAKTGAGGVMRSSCLQEGVLTWFRCALVCLLAIEGVSMTRSRFDLFFNLTDSFSTISSHICIAAITKQFKNIK